MSICSSPVRLFEPVSEPSEFNQNRSRSISPHANIMSNNLNQISKRSPRAVTWKVTSNNNSLRNDNGMAASKDHNPPANISSTSSNHVGTGKTVSTANSSGVSDSKNRTSDIPRILPEHGSLEAYTHSAAGTDCRGLQVVKTYSSCLGCRWVWVKAIIRWKRGALRNTVGDKNRSHRGSPKNCTCINCVAFNSTGKKGGTCSRITNRHRRRAALLHSPTFRTEVDVIEGAADNNVNSNMHVDDVDDELMDVENSCHVSSNKICDKHHDLSHSSTQQLVSNSLPPSAQISHDNNRRVIYKSRAHSFFSNMNELNFLSKSANISRHSVPSLFFKPILKRRLSSSNLYMGSVSRVLNPQGIASSIQISSYLSKSSDVLSNPPETVENTHELKKLSNKFNNGQNSNSPVRKIEVKSSSAHTQTELRTRNNTLNRMTRRRSSSSSSSNSSRRNSLLDFMILTRHAFSEVLPTIYWTNLVSLSTFHILLHGT